jgi:internalin A
MSNCSRVSDLTPLGFMVNLHSLDISGCDGVSDVTPLGALVSLRSLKIGGYVYL